MMDRIEYIRQEEKKYHESCYDNYTLFEEGSWLHKPVKTVIDALALLANKENLTILDLGCGVGRNSIPIAEKVKNSYGKVISVDLLETALQKLKQYSQAYHVEDVIHLHQADLSDFVMKKDRYDYIIAVSSLEHVRTEETFIQVLQSMEAATKSKGVNCLIVNSNVEEIDIETRQKKEVLLEINLPTDEMMNILQKVYRNWKTIHLAVKPLTYHIKRDQTSIKLKTNAITLVVQK